MEQRRSRGRRGGGGEEEQKDKIREPLTEVREKIYDVYDTYIGSGTCYMLLLRVYFKVKGTNEVQDPKLQINSKETILANSKKSEFGRIIFYSLSVVWLVDFLAIPNYT